MKTYIRALSIAGFDGSGGAGIQADLKAFSALGCYGMTVLTALPVQNTQGVRSIYPIEVKCVEEQLHAIFEDIDVDVIKIGMLHRCDIIHAVADILEQYAPVKIVLDPVMVSKNGQALLTSDAVETVKKRLFPLATVITPNLPETSFLLNREIINEEMMIQAAQDLFEMGPKAVIVKGGHLESDLSSDCLYIKPHIYWLSSPRIITHNTHGTGCTFSAALAAFLAKGLEIVAATHAAKEYLTQCIQSGAEFSIGKGHGPVHHFSSIWK